MAEEHWPECRCSFVTHSAKDDEEIIHDNLLFANDVGVRKQQRQ